MKRGKEIEKPRIERPRRAVVSEKEALKRMKDFSKRKGQFLGTARTGKGRSLRPCPVRTSQSQHISVFLSTGSFTKSETCFHPEI